MNRQAFIKNVADLLRERNIKKPISIPKQVFHISDNDGNSKDFTIKKTDKSVLYTRNDVELIVDACLAVIEDSIKRGEPVSFHGFGTLGLNYRKPRTTKCVGTDEDIVIEGHYVPKFSFGNNLKMCAKIYELSLNDRLSGDIAIDEDAEVLNTHVD